MFRKFTKNPEILCPLIYADQHTTSPGQAVEGIPGGSLNIEEPEQKAHLYDKAREIYFRAQRSRRARSASIL